MEKRGFLDGIGRLRRITATPHEADIFFDPSTTTLVQEHRSHHEIVVVKFSGTLAIGEIAADHAGRVKDQVWFGVREEPTDLTLVQQVAFGSGWRDGREPTCAEKFDEVAAHETIRAGH